MISSLRNKKKLITFSLWFIIAAFVGTIFFVWGVGDKVQEQLYAAKVNGSIISDQQFRQKVEDTRNQFRQLFGNNIDDVLKENTIERTVMDNLVNETLLMLEADRLNIPASDAEVAANIQAMQVFQTDGKFDQQRYVQILARNRLTPEAFEAGLRDDLTLKKMEQLIRQSVDVSKQEINNEYIYRNTQAAIRYLELAANDFVGAVEITDDALAAFYDAHKEEYRVPVKADFKYVEFDPNTYTGEAQVSDAEVENFFIKNKASFTEAEKVDAAHILFKVDNWEDEMAANDVYKKAKAVKEQLDKGADFAAMAKKYSADSNAANGGNLGFFTKGQMVPEFEKAAFETKTGEISNVVKTEFGFHIIKVNEHVAEKKPTLDEAREKIVELIKEQKGNSAFRTYVFDTYKQIITKSNITAYNEQAETKLPVKEVKGLSADGNVAPLLMMADIAKKLLSMNKSEVSQVVEVGDKKMIFEMTEKYESYIPAVNDIKDQLTADFVNVKSLELAQAKAEMAASLTTMDEAAEMLKKSYITTPKFKRNDPIAGMGIDQDLMTAIFEAKAGDFIQQAYTIGTKVFLVQVKEINKPLADTATKREEGEIKSALFGVKSEEAVQSYLDNLRSKAKIEVNQRYAKYYN